MASSSSLVQFLFLLFFVSHLPSSFSRPANMMFDLGRDSSTLQYWIKINQGTPQTAMKLVLDLGGKLPWLRCHKGYNSSSIRPVKCTTALCSLASKPVNSTCLPKKTCSIYTSNPVTKSVGKGELMSDRVAVKSNPDDSEGIPVVSPRRFAFGCTTTSNFLSGLFKGAKGVAGLGRSSALSVVTVGAMQKCDGFMEMILKERLVNWKVRL